MWLLTYASNQSVWGYKHAASFYRPLICLTWPRLTLLLSILSTALYPTRTGKSCLAPLPDPSRSMQCVGATILLSPTSWGFLLLLFLLLTQGLKESRLVSNSLCSQIHGWSLTFWSCLHPQIAGTGIHQHARFRLHWNSNPEACAG